MNRSALFASRNAKEILRDPLSYIFCLGFPVIMLVVMSVVNESIPPQAGMVIFRIDNLAPAIAFFGLMFTMLMAALQISKDRGSSFLIRLYASPMKAWDFIGGYFLPMMFIALAQLLVCAVCSAVIASITDVELNIGSLLLSVPVMLIPAALMTGFGMLFGSLFSEKAAPGLCSIIISVGSMLGGIFMDVDALGGVILKICKVLPFYYCVTAGRCALSGELGEMVSPLIVSAGYTIAVIVLAVLAFRRRMKADMN